MSVFGRAGYIVALCALVIIAAFLGLLVYWFFDREPPVRIQHPEIRRLAGIDGQERVPVFQPSSERQVCAVKTADSEDKKIPPCHLAEFFAGETILVWRGACVDRRTTVSGRRWLADTEIVLLLDAAEIDESIPVGECQSRWMALEMPKTIGSGAWSYNSERLYPLNPLRNVGGPLGPVTLRWPVIWFRIIPPAPNKKIEVLEKKVEKLEKKVEQITPPVKPGPQGPQGIQGKPGPAGPAAPPPEPRVRRWWQWN